MKSGPVLTSMAVAVVVVVVGFSTGFCTPANSPPSESGLCTFREARLSWAAPDLEAPARLRIGPEGGTFRLEDRDYIVDIDTTVHQAVALVGGRNVVMIGGHITIDHVEGDRSIEERRALLLKDQRGTVHVEGLLIDDSGGDLSEGIQIAAPDAVVQLQNVRITGIHARDEIGFTDNHPDLVQSWGGVKELRIDRLTGSTDYQGLFLTRVGAAHIRNVNIRGTSTARYLIWKDGNEEATWPLILAAVWLRPASGRTLARTFWPDVNAHPRVAPTEADGRLVWPAESGTTGAVRGGDPAVGDLVPASRVGTRYDSPGYQCAVLPPASSSGAGVDE